MEGQTNGRMVEWITTTTTTTTAKTKVRVDVLNTLWEKPFFLLN